MSLDIGWKKLELEEKTIKTNSGAIEVTCVDNVISEGCFFFSTIGEICSAFGFVNEGVKY